jgi:hypothetical protein
MCFWNVKVAVYGEVVLYYPNSLHLDDPNYEILYVSRG